MADIGTTPQEEVESRDKVDRLRTGLKNHLISGLDIFDELLSAYRSTKTEEFSRQNACAQLLSMSPETWARLFHTHGPQITPRPHNEWGTLPPDAKAIFRSIGTVVSEEVRRRLAPYRSQEPSRQ